LRRAKAQHVAAASVEDITLDELRRVKDAIGDRINDATLPAHVQAKLLGEFRLYVEAILRIERSRPQQVEPKKLSKADELRARRDARLAAADAAGE
jgi:hypothetical protein